MKEQENKKDCVKESQHKLFVALTLSVLTFTLRVALLRHVRCRSVNQLVVMMYVSAC